MATFKWNDKRLPLVEVKELLVGEARWVERQAKVNLNDMGIADTLVARVIVSLKHQNIHMRWQDFDDMSLDSFDVVDDEEPDDDEATEDPTPSGAEAGQSSSTASSEPATSGGSSS